MKDMGIKGPRAFGPREMIRATCSRCGKDCEVPFKLHEGKPVYCQKCRPGSSR
jgi:CxxC-x17-CxxC domain-containing protein